ncbi:MAG TPA: SURF1 family protein [Jatrophihabitans sp.]|nr:SURF1 family protein [Jatrophihabitans sp.]
MLATLRQPRYLGLFGLMLVLAIVCGIAGTWQIYRFEQKRTANHHLRADNRDVPVDIGTALGPAASPTSTGRAEKFRPVTATGSYLAANETLLRGQTVDGDVGYLVLTPLRTEHGVLLVARGFVPETGAAKSSPPVAPAPTGSLTVTARLEPADSRPDKFGQLPGRQVDSVNAEQQASRIGSPVWPGYAELLAGQPGTAGLRVIPGPDMSNPAGGAVEPQHAAYVVQWYLFGLLALAAPFILAAAEQRRDEESEPAKPTKKASLDDRLAGRA